MKHDEILDSIFLETTPGVLVSVNRNDTAGATELVLCRKDIEAKYFELLSAAPMMYKALSLIHEQATRLQNVLDIAKVTEPGLKDDPTMRAFTISFELLERLCVEAQSCAQLGVSKTLKLIAKEK